jgi:hypothetical protein
MNALQLAFTSHNMQSESILLDRIFECIKDIYCSKVSPIRKLRRIGKTQGNAIALNLFTGSVYCPQSSKISQDPVSSSQIPIPYQQHPNKSHLLLLDSDAGNGTITGPESSINTQMIPWLMHAAQATLVLSGG